MTGSSIKSGLIAGFAATCVLSLLMLLKGSVGLLPQLNPIHDIVDVADKFTGADFPSALGWAGHFFLGTIVWGLVFAWLEAALPGVPIVKGLLFGFFAWVLMMVLFMPLAGQGFFGFKNGPPAAVASLILHLIYGAVLGLVYASRQSRTSAGRMRTA
jgi:uncharacterized membrane protein YagU involved in acid resistance